MNKYIKVVVNSILTGGITFLSTLVPFDFAGAWKPAVISAAIAGGLSLLIELKRGVDKPPAGNSKDKKMSVGKKARGVLMSIGFI